MNYNEAREYVLAATKLGSVMGLDTIKELLKRLGNPHLSIQKRVVHVAGTNGKGSTMAYIASVCMEAGYKVGKYNSPAVFDPLEIITVNNVNITEDEYAMCATEVQKQCDAMVADGLSHPTYFEIETAMAFWFLAQSDCDIYLIECGMGGRDDATNVLETNLLSVITSIGLDHTDFLGATIEEITANKEGIIKPGRPVVRAGSGDTITEVNKELARKACQVLIKEGYNLEDYIETGLSKMKWPGRMEQIHTNPTVIIDGAHNPDAMTKLRNALDTTYGGQKKIFIVGVLADKDYEKEGEIIADRAEHIITVTPDNKRALDGSVLAQKWHKYNSNITSAATIKEAVEKAFGLVSDNDDQIIVAFGSLSYLKDLKNVIIDIR